MRPVAVVWVRVMVWLIALSQAEMEVGRGGRGGIWALKASRRSSDSRIICLRVWGFEFRLVDVAGGVVGVRLVVVVWSFMLSLDRY